MRCLKISFPSRSLRPITPRSTAPSPSWPGLGTKLAGLISLDATERRTISKMGEKSEAFCRRTLVTMSESPTLIPSGVDLAEALRDMAQLDALRQLMGRVDDSEMPLGSDMASRFSRKAAADKSPADAR